MRDHNPKNERVKRKYFIYLREAKRQSEATVDSVADAITRFEAYTGWRDFQAFHHDQAVAFKRKLEAQNAVASGKPLSKATLYSVMSHLKRFFQWLAGQPGFRSRIRYSDADYFNVSEKDARIATARRSPRMPTLEQVMHVISLMPTDSEVDMRNRALVAFTLLTGARDSAAISAKMKHLDIVCGTFYQDAREVKTKFSKTFTTEFFPVDPRARRIVEEWVDYLRAKKLWGNDDPLFPKTLLSVGSNHQFEHNQIERAHWANATPVRAIFRRAFENAGLPYFNPHSIRHTLAQMGQRLCGTPEEFKAWSQNLGHEQVMTTLTSYGTVPEGRQRELIRAIGRIDS